MEILSKYIVVVVVAICFAIGYIIKHSLDFIPNKYIPLILAALGVILNMWINDWRFTPNVLLGGLASGLASTGSFELVRNLVNKNGGKPTSGKQNDTSGCSPNDTTSGVTNDTTNNSMVKKQSYRNKNKVTKVKKQK